MSGLLLEPIQSPAVWVGADMTQQDDWIWNLTAEEHAELNLALDHVRSRKIELYQMQAGDFPLPTLGSRLKAIAAEVDQGRGFFLLRGLAVDRYPLEDLRLMFWGMSRHVGEPEPQDGAGALMHDVRDTGQKVRGTANVRGFQTNEELHFHNDGGDAFMLLCRRTARSGGVSKLVSVAALFNRLLAERPDLAAALQQPFHFDARQQQPNGLPAVQLVPILRWFAGRLFVIYKRGYIKTAQRFADVPPLSAIQLEALDAMDRLCDDPSLHLSFVMRPGDIQFGSNHAVLHSRTQYVDSEQAELRRHMLRVWLTLPNGSALPPEFARTREFAYTYARRSQDQQRENAAEPA